MNLRKILLISVAATGICAITALPVPSYGPIGEASAATSVNVNISIGTFYDRLDPYGDWTWYRGRYVWVPDRIGPRWRPYTVGHWVYTRRHGWYWVSDEPFGWAAYHYGRWGFSPTIGWFWIPGRRWAPAWVAWHHTDRYVGWAPLPPEWDDPNWDDDDDFDVSVSFDTVPNVYWQVVPFNAFLSIDLSDHVIRDRERVREVVRYAEPTVVHIENNVVVNNFIDIDVIEEKTDKKVVVHEPKPASDPEAAGTTDGETVAVFDAEVKEDPVAKPKKVKKVEEIEKKYQALAIEEPDLEEPQAEEPPVTTEEQPVKKKKKQAIEAIEEGQPPAIEGVTPEEQPAKKKKKQAIEAIEEGQPPAVEAVTPEEQPMKKKKKAALQDTEEIQPPPEAITTEEQPVKKKRKKAVEAVEEGQPPAAEAAPTEEQPGKKKKKKLVQQQEEAPAEEPAAQKSAKKKKKDTAECDPSVQDCAQAE